MGGEFLIGHSYFIDHHHRWRTNDDDDTLNEEKQLNTEKKQKTEQNYSRAKNKPSKASHEMAATMLAMPLDGKDWDWNQGGRRRER